MLDKSKAISPSRRYVAMCLSVNFDRVYFRSFTLPEKLSEQEVSLYGSGPRPYIANNADEACAYFLRVLDFQACVETVFPEENLKAFAESVTTGASLPRELSFA